MKKRQKELIDILKILIETEKFENLKINNESLSLILDEAKNQGVITIISPVVEKIIAKENFDFLDRKIYQNEMSKALKYNLVISQQISMIVQNYYKKGMKPIIIKGLAISRLYKNSTTRLMADLDLLIHPDEWEKSKKNILEIGYNQSGEHDNHPVHIEYNKKNFISVELHRRLVHTGFFGQRDTKIWYKNIWERKIIVEYDTSSFYAMTEEDELIFQILHFATHLIYIGVTLKHIFEIGLIIKSKGEKFDWEYTKEMLNTLGFLQFAKLLISSCSRLFNINVPKDMSDIDNKIVDDFSYNLFNGFSNEKNKGDFRGWMHISSRCSNVFKWRFFEPLYWLVELKCQAKIHNYKVPFVIKNSKRNIGIINKRLKIIRKYLT